MTEEQIKDTSSLLLNTDYSQSTLVAQGAKSSSVTLPLSSTNSNTTTNAVNANSSTLTNSINNSNSTANNSISTEPIVLYLCDLFWVLNKFIYQSIFLFLSLFL